LRRGAYQLLIRLDRDETIPVGKLGTFEFPAGFYVYTGSAMNGLDARIARHLSKTKRFHWHIDFLLERSTIIRYAIEECSSRRECEINAATLAMPGARAIVEGFGSSDCRCRSHLVYLETEPVSGLGRWNVRRLEGSEPSNLQTFEPSNGVHE
jgi:Uri superfamily endonuclease